MFLAWSSALETGVAQMDEQHRKLIELINSLERAHQAGGDAQALNLLLPELADYAVFHFDMEEKLMAEVVSGSEFEKRHRDEHTKFTRQIHDMQLDRRDDKRLIVASLVVFLQLWLEDHILGIDKELASYIAARS